MKRRCRAKKVSNIRCFVFENVCIVQGIVEEDDSGRE